MSAFSGDDYSAVAETLGVVGGQKDKHLVRQRRHTNDLFSPKNGISSSGIYLLVLPSVRKTKHILNMYSRHQKTRTFKTFWQSGFGRKLDG